MGRKIIAALMLTGALGGFASLGPVPHTSAQVNNQETVTVGPTVQGEVTQKFTPSKGGSYYIAVNGEPYEVPLNLYERVDVGTVVQFDGTNWTIISGGI